MVVNGVQDLGCQYYSYTKNKETSPCWLILFSHWPSKQYIPKERGRLRDYTKPNKKQQGNNSTTSSAATLPRCYPEECPPRHCRQYLPEAPVDWS